MLWGGQFGYSLSCSFHIGGSFPGPSLGSGSWLRLLLSVPLRAPTFGLSLSLSLSLRRRSAKPMCSPRVGSNPTGVDFLRVSCLQSQSEARALESEHSFFLLTKMHLDLSWKRHNISLHCRELIPGLLRDSQEYWPLYYSGGYKGPLSSQGHCPASLVPFATTG